MKATVNFDPTIDSKAARAGGLCDAQGRFLLVSDFYRELTQRSVDELTTTRWQQIVHPDDVQLCETGYDRLIGTGEPFDATCRLVRPDQSIVWAGFRVWQVTGRRDMGPAAQFDTWLIDDPRIEIAGSADVRGFGDDACLSYVQQMASELARITGQRRFLSISSALSVASLIASAEIGRRSGFPEDRFPANSTLQ